MKLTKGTVYQTAAHGLVEFVGLDEFHGQVTYHFKSGLHGDLFRTPGQLQSFIGEQPKREYKKMNGEELYALYCAIDLKINYCENDKWKDLEDGTRATWNTLADEIEAKT